MGFCGFQGCLILSILPCSLLAPAVKDHGTVLEDTTYSLVAFPVKDNYEGRLYSMDWIEKVCH